MQYKQPADRAVPGEVPECSDVAESCREVFAIESQRKMALSENPPSAGDG